MLSFFAIVVIFAAADLQLGIVAVDDEFGVIPFVNAPAGNPLAQVKSVGCIPGINYRLFAAVVVVHMKQPIIVAPEGAAVGPRQSR